MIKQTLMQNFGFTHWVLTQNLDGITHTESLVPPTEGANSLNWTVGHILNSRNGAHELLGLEPAIAPERIARYKQGQEPMAADDPGILPLEELVQAINASQDALMAKLEKATDDELAAPCPHILSKDEQSQVGIQLGGLNFHEAYHTGQTGVLRRMAGKTSTLPSPE